MKQTDLTLAIEEVVTLKTDAIDRLVKELVEPLADVGNPEKLINKKYENWTPEDLQVLSKIYGSVEPNPLSETIFRHKYAEVKELEEEEHNA